MRDVKGRYKFSESQERVLAESGLLPSKSATKTLSVASHKFTVDELVRMAELGILETDVRVELIDGVLLEMAPTGRPHGNGVSSIARAFWENCPRNVQVYLGSTVRLTDYTGPQPDVALIRPEASFQKENVPRAEDILLVVEVAGSSLQRDRGEKARRYAESGIPELWIFVLENDEIEISRQPTPEGYADVQVYRRGDALTIQELPGIQFSVGDLLS
jgi:Uma2 family endonuclease